MIWLFSSISNFSTNLVQVITILVKPSYLYQTSGSIILKLTVAPYVVKNSNVQLWQSSLNKKNEKGPQPLPHGPKWTFWSLSFITILISHIVQEYGCTMDWARQVKISKIQMTMKTWTLNFMKIHISQS